MPTLSIGVEKPSYLPGETINGELVLENTEKQKSKFLKIAILGEVYTHWTESETRSRTGSDGKSETYTVSIDYFSRIEIVNQYKLFWNWKEAQKIPIGTSAYDFSFYLPPICPPTFQGTYGKVTYKIMAILDRPWKFDVKNEKIIDVTPILNLNTIPTALQPFEELRSKNTGLIFKNGIVEVMVKMPKQGFIPGEHVPILISMCNNSSKPMSQLQVKLSQHTHNTAHREGNRSTRAHARDEWKRCVEIERKLQVPAGGKAVERVQLMVPYDLVQSFDTQIVKTEYLVHVKVSTTSTFKSSVVLEVPVIIGTVWAEQEPPGYIERAPPSYKEAMSCEKM